MSPLSRWLVCLTTVLLLLLSCNVAYSQDAPPSLPSKPLPALERAREQEREQIRLELERSASPQIALYTSTFLGTVSNSGEPSPFAPDNPRATVYTFFLPANVSLLLVEVIATSAYDLDLFVGADLNGDGLPDPDEITCASLSASRLDWCAARRPPGGPAWVIAYSYTGSNAPPDDFRIDISAYGSEVRFGSSAAFEDGAFARVGESVAFTIEVQPPLPLSAPLTYTISNLLPDGLVRVQPAPGDPAARVDTPSDWLLTTSGEPISVTYQAVVSDSVALDTALINQLVYSAGEERRGRTQTQLYVRGVELSIVATGAPTAALGSAAPFTVTVANHGVQAAANLTVTVDVPGGAQHVAGGSLHGQQLLWWIDQLDAGASVDLGFTLQLMSEAKGSSPAPRIVGGEEAEPGAWPWQVAMWDMDYDGWWGCGGSLIAQGWVMTAAHCVTNYGFVAPASAVGAAIGRHNLHSAEGYLIGVSEVLVHPQYDISSREFDVALLRLSEPVTLSERIAVAPLATAAHGELFADGVAATATGWGTRSPGFSDFPAGLHQVEVQLYSNERCDADYAQLNYPGVIRSSMICAGLPEGGKDTCQGDSGGPLVVRNGDNGWLQVGVTSWGYGCANPHAPGVYSRVPSFVDWVKQQVRTLQLKEYSVTDDSGLPGHAAVGSSPVTTTFTEVFSTIWTPLVIAGGDGQR